MEILGYIVLFIIFMSGVVFRKSKAIMFVMLLYMWVMIALNTDSPDYENYEFIYKNAQMVKASFEPIYMLICLFCRQLSMSFLTFRGVIAFIIVLFIYLTMKRLPIGDNYILSLFLLYPFAGFISSIRAAVATVIIMYAFTFLIDKKEKTYVKYVIFILIASGFQYFSLFFLIFIILNKTNKYLIYGAYILCPLIVVLFHNGSIFKLMNQFTSDNRILHWFDPEELRMMKPVVVLIIACIQISYVIGTHIAIKRIKKKQLNYRMLNNKSLDLWNKANIFLLCLIPLYILQPVFIRMFNATVFLNGYLMLVAFTKSYVNGNIEKKYTQNRTKVYIPKRVTYGWFFLNGIFLTSFIWFEGILEADYFMIGMFCKNLIFGEK